MLEFRSIRAKYLQAVASYQLKVLIWGPGKNSSDKKDVYEKRKQVRDVLRTRRQDAFFSEDIPIITDETGSGLPLNINELFQSENFDLVINIADSPGSLMEAEKFSLGLSNRCLLWLRKGSSGFQSGLARQLASIGLQPMYFDDSDVKSCVIALACEDWVNSMRTLEVEYDVLEAQIARNRIRKRGMIQ
jgi:hypothetical protein